MQIKIPKAQQGQHPQVPIDPLSPKDTNLCCGSHQVTHYEEWEFSNQKVVSNT